MIAETISTKKTQILDDETYRRAHLVTRAISHPLRLRMLRFIEHRGGIDKVSDIYDSELFATDGKSMEQPIASQHLRILRNAGLVQYEKEGSFHRYTIIKKNLARLSVLCDELSEYHTA